jgi:serine/threonine protein kinase
MIHSHYRSAHVLKTYDAFFVHDALYIVTEFMQYGNLISLSKALTGGRGGVGSVNFYGRHPMPERVLAVIAEQVALGLRDMHERGQIHRDIKPSNILVNDVGAVKLSDFGLTVAVGGPNDNTVDASLCSGTEWYMSPERMRGECHGAPSDIWALGLTLADCAIGHFPFDRSTCTSDFDKIKLITKPISYPADIAPKLSADFRTFVQKCLNADPKLRPTAKELLDHPLLQKWKSNFDFGGYLKESVQLRKRKELDAADQRMRSLHVQQQMERRYSAGDTVGGRRVGSRQSSAASSPVLPSPLYAAAPTPRRLSRLHVDPEPVAVASPPAVQTPLAEPGPSTPLHSLQAAAAAAAASAPVQPLIPSALKALLDEDNAHRTASGHGGRCLSLGRLRWAHHVRDRVKERQLSRREKDRRILANLNGGGYSSESDGARMNLRFSESKKKLK